MKVSFQNFGQAGQGEISIHDLTIICGPNNSGKTYTSYAIYAILKYFPQFFDFGIPNKVYSDLYAGRAAKVNIKEIRSDFNRYLEGASKKFVAGLDRFFNAPDDFFASTSFSISLDESEMGPPSNYRMSAKINAATFVEADFDEDSGILTFVYSQSDETRPPRSLLNSIVSEAILAACLKRPMPTPFVVTSERTGVALFYKDLDYNSNAILSHLRDSEKIDPIKILEAMRSRYARPIQDNIDTVRDYENLAKRKSYLRTNRDQYKPVFEALGELLLGGSFRSQNGQLTYSLRKKKNKPKVEVPLYIASSSVKSLFLVDTYLNNIAQEDQILIIDEPELNLHPDNQVKMARLIARIVNSGTKVLLTTHSDYIVREINNLVTIGSAQSKASNLKRKYGMDNMDMLSAHQIGAYCSSPTHGLHQIPVTETGVDTGIFDDIIASENFKAQEIQFVADE